MPLRRNVMSEIDSPVNSSVPRNGGEMVERALRRAAAKWDRTKGPDPTASPAASGRPIAPSRIPTRLAVPCEDGITSDDTTVKVPGEIDAQPARRIIEELRRRFSEAFRPQLELDYIE